MKQMIMMSLALIVFAVLLSAMSSPAHSKSDNDALTAEQTRINRGLSIAPVPLNLSGKSRALVDLGSYIVNAQSECNDCHTCPTYEPGQNPFNGVGNGHLNSANYLAGGVHFGRAPNGENIVSANLTPQSDGKPAGLDFDEFRTLIRTGHDPDEDPDEVLQVMPWPFFRHMTDRDLHAIYEYLRSIPAASPGHCSGPGQ